MPLPQDFNNLLKAVFSGAYDESSQALRVISGEEPNTSNAVNATVASADTTTPATVCAAQASKKIYITDIIISTDTAMNIQLEDGDGTVMMEQIYVPASSVFSKSFRIPLAQPAVNKTIKVRGSLAGNVTVTVTGYALEP